MLRYRLKSFISRPTYVTRFSAVSGVTWRRSVALSSVTKRCHEIRTSVTVGAVFIHSLSSCISFWVHTAHIPGAAAPCYFLMKMIKIVLLTSRTVIGLGGHQSKKKSIWRFLNFSRWFLKEFMLGASTASWERLFHLFVLRWEKKWWRIYDCGGVTSSTSSCVHEYCWQ